MEIVPTPASFAEVLAEGPFAPSQIQIHWHPAPLVPPPAVAAFIDERWQHYLAQARSEQRDLFNSPMTAVTRFAARPGVLAIELRPSDYKTFMVSCVRDRGWFERHAPDCIAVTPGNTALLTCDDRAYLGLRSIRVSTYPRRVHAFGGALELDPAHPPTAAGALLSHIEKELHEELGLTSAAFVAAPALLGVYRDPALWQPEFIWQCQLHAPPDHVHPHEHDGLISFGPVAVGDEELLTPAAAAALRSWRSQHA